MLLVLLEHGEARQQLLAMQSTLLAIAKALGGPESKFATERAEQELSDRAFPRVYPPLPDETDPDEDVTDG